MSQILSKTIIESMTSLLANCNFIILWGGGGVKVQLLTKLSIFLGIKLKFGGGGNSETLISCFLSILPYKMNLIKVKGFYVIIY